IRHARSPVSCRGRRTCRQRQTLTMTVLVVLGCAAAFAPFGCAPETTVRTRAYRTATHRPLSPPLMRTDVAGATAAAAAAPIRDAGPIRRITAVSVRVPASWQTPPLVGRLQHHRIVAGENLLAIARAAG